MGKSHLLGYCRKKEKKEIGEIIVVNGCCWRIYTVLLIGVGVMVGKKGCSLELVL